MSKNLTRKGLALGAVVALGSSLFAGTPANANPTAITFASAYGTSTTGVLGEYFYLSTLITGGVNGTAIEWLVEGATAANIEAQTRKTTSLTATAASGTTQYAAETEVATDNAAKIATIPTTSNSQTGYQAGSFVQLAIRLTAGVTSTTSVKITPFIDSQLADDKITTGELTGTPITVNFIKGSELTATPTIKAPSVGSAVEATVAVSGGVNLEHFRTQATGAVADSSAFNVKFRSNGTLGGVSTPARWNATDSEFVAVSTDSSLGTNSAVAGRIYGATALIGSVDSASAGIVTASAGEVASLDQITMSGSSYNASFKSSTHVLRAGAGSFTLETAVATVATGKLKSGQKVSFKITEQGNNTLTSGASFTAGGKTLTNSSTSTQQSITVEATSDANGDVSLPVTYTGLASADQVTVQAFAVPASTGSALIAAGTTRTLTGQSSIAATVVDEITSAGATASVRYVVRGGTVSIPVQVVDQFGQVPTGTFRLGLTYTNVSGTDVAPGLTTPVAVVNGKATVNVIDNSSDARVFTVTSTLAKLNADGVTWETGTTAGFEAAETVVSRISSGAAAVTVGSIALSASSTNNVNRAGKTLASGNSDLGAIWNSPTKAVDLTTSVAANTGAAVPGAAVTFSAAGVLFKANNVFGLGSLVVNSASDGTLPTVEVYSNLVGDVTITATSAGVSKTQVIKFATPTSGGASWAVTAPTNILPGQSLRVTATLRDKFGGAVNTSGTADTVKVEYTGPGFVTAAMPTTTNASGQVSFTVLLGAADSGTATVKITYAGADNITAATATDDVVSTTSITIGAAPVAAPAGAVARIAGSTNRFFVSVDGNTLARNVVVRVAGRSFATLKGSATNRSYAVRAPKGSHKVTVFVGGKLIATKTITVR